MSKGDVLNRNIIIFLIFISFPCIAAADPLSILFIYEEKSNPPYSIGDGQTVPAEKPGINVEVLKGLENKLNVRIRFERYNWKRCLKMLESNEADGIFEASFKPDRMSIGVYPIKNGEPDSAKRLMSNSYVLYKMKNSPVQWDGKQFSYLIKPIGAAAAYSIVSDLKEMGVNVMESYTQSDAFKILIKGRLDGVADLETMADLILKGNPEEFKDVVKVSPPIRTKEYYLMFSHRFAEKLPKVMNDIWNELQRVRESGEYDKIAEKYAEMPK